MNTITLLYIRILKTKYNAYKYFDIQFNDIHCLYHAFIYAFIYFDVILF